MPTQSAVTQQQSAEIISPDETAETHHRVQEYLKTGLPKIRDMARVPAEVAIEVANEVMRCIRRSDELARAKNKPANSLLKCTLRSIGIATIEACRTGLPPNLRGDGWLIKYADQCTYQIGYQGMVREYYGLGAERVYFDCVYEGDTFDFREGSSRVFEFSPLIDGGPRRNLLGAFCFVKWKDEPDDAWQAVWVPRWEIEKHKKASPAGSDGPWGSWEHQMAAKTAVRAFYKISRRKSTRLAQWEAHAVSHEDMTLDTLPTIIEPTQQPQQIRSDEPDSTARVSKGQANRWYAVAKNAGWTSKQMTALLKQHDIPMYRAIPENKFAKLLAIVEQPPFDDNGTADAEPKSSSGDGPVGQLFYPDSFSTEECAAVEKWFKETAKLDEFDADALNEYLAGYEGTRDDLMEAVRDHLPSIDKKKKR